MIRKTRTNWSRSILVPKIIYVRSTVDFDAIKNFSDSIRDNSIENASSEHDVLKLEFCFASVQQDFDQTADYAIFNFWADI